MFPFKKFIAGFKAQEGGTPGRAGKTLLNAQKQTADYLNRKTAGWSPLKTKVMLIVFCLVTGNACLYLIGKAVLSANGPPGVKIQRLAAPTVHPPEQRADSSIKIHH